MRLLNWIKSKFRRKKEPIVYPEGRVEGPPVISLAVHPQAPSIRRKLERIIFIMRRLEGVSILPKNTRAALRENLRILQHQVRSVGVKPPETVHRAIEMRDEIKEGR